MLTVDYTFYAGMFRGSLSEEAFDRLKIPAGAWLDQATFGRVNGPLPTPTPLAAPREPADGASAG